MDATYVFSSPARSVLNATGEIINRWNVNLPSYLYREIPAVFETVGTMLNIAIVIYFIKSKKYRMPTFTILTSLAAMDTCVCLGGVIQMFITPKVVTPEAGFMCGLSVFVLVTGITGSEYTLIFFAGMRLYQVLSPLKARASITMSLIVKWCATINAVSAGLSLIHAAFWRSVTTVTNKEDITVCIFIGDSYSKDLVALLVSSVIPCFTIFLLHVLKYFAYVRSKELFATKQERKSMDAHVVAIVISLFYICWIPVTTYIIIQNLRIDSYVLMEDTVYAVLAHVSYANSIMNPLIYVLAMKSIRDDVIKLFCFARQSYSKY